MPIATQRSRPEGARARKRKNEIAARTAYAGLPQRQAASAYAASAARRSSVMPPLSRTFSVSSRNRKTPARKKAIPQNDVAPAPPRRARRGAFS
jgi:predicted component of type VI protein secretion system